MIKGGFKGGFSIKKKEAKVQNVTKRGFEKIEEDKNNAEIIHTVDEGGIVGTNIKVEDKPLIIPCIKVNKWNDIKNGNGKRSQVDRGEVRANKKQFEKDTNDEAINQIINDANRFLDQQENKSDAKTLNIPLLMQNRIPEGEELEEGPLKVEIRPESSNLDDYDAVPIGIDPYHQITGYSSVLCKSKLESFGLGMLRGMGWNEAEGIGKTRQNISEFITNVRPKGLGLGAIPVKKKLENNAKANNQAPLTMRPGAFVRLIDGPYKERYGKVLSLDGDLGRVTIKWALGKYGAPSEVNEIFTEVVSQKEYDDNGKDISRTTKVALEEKQKIIDLDQQQSISNMVSNLKKKPTKSKKEYGKSRKPAETKWVHIGLIVQYVGDRKSKHYMQKFEVRKVKSRSAIACRYLEKEKEYDFHERDLQTVVPKNEGQIIMVLKGSLSGTFGRVIERQKEKDRVMVELFNENKDVERIDFDNVCQFNGTISDFTMSATTLLGRKRTDELGFVLAHEHLKMNFECSFHSSPYCPLSNDAILTDMSNRDSAMVRQFPYHFRKNLDFTDYDAVLESLKTYQALGGGTLVEVSTVGLQRDPESCARLSQESNVNVIMGTGYYVDAANRTDTKTYSVESLNQFISDELRNGFHGHEGRFYPGVVGEMGCTWPITDFERRHLQAAGALHATPGTETAPITIHPGRDPSAPAEIMRILLEAGAKGDKIVMGHLDRTIHDRSKLAEFGDTFKCYLEYDLFGIEVSHYQFDDAVFMPNDGERLHRIKHLMDAGFEDRILIGQDIHTSHRLEKYGGHGYGHLLRVVQHQAKTAGITSDQWSKISTTNPQTWLQSDIQ